MSLPTIEDCKIRLRTFLSTLKRSNIRFRYFTRDMSTPQIAENLLEWKINDELCYIVNGITEPWSYTYSKSSLKNIIVNSTTHSNVEEYNSEIKIIGGNINQGDHITIGAVKHKSDPNLWMYTHKTIYNETDDPNIWVRSIIECNFILSNSIVEDSSKCYNSSENFGYKYASDPLAKEIIINMNKIYCNTYQIKGGHNVIIYKNTGWSDEFMSFLYRYIILPVKNLRNDLENIIVLYDELSELDENGNANKHIVFIYEFRDIRSVFYIDTLKALTAYYAYINQTTAINITVDESRCLLDFFKSVELPRQMITT